MFKFKFISDLHLERKLKHVLFKKEQLGGILLLAGDIGSPFKKSYWDFLQYTSDNFDKVYFITGNHEYWNSKKYTMTDVDMMIEDKTENLKNVQFLNNDVDFINGYKIVGSTLWSYTHNHKSFNYKYTYMDDNTKLNVKEHNKLFLNNLRWIYSQLDNNHIITPTIMLTHHIPSMSFTKIDSKYIPYKSLFASDLDHLIQYPVKSWIFGHTHDKFIRNIRGVQCGVNSWHGLVKNEYILSEIELPEIKK